MKLLTKKHPLQKKVNALEGFMDNNNLRIESVGGNIIITDTFTDLEVFYCDEDNSDNLQEIPYFLETKLIIVGS